MSGIETLIAAFVLAAPYIFGGLLNVERFPHRRRWLSAAAGAAMAYVFVDMLPEMARMQERFTEATGQLLPLTATYEIYLAALLGFALFYGFDNMVSWFRRGQTDTDNDAVYWIHLSGVAGYGGLISYLMVHQPRHHVQLGLYCFAMGLHFMSMNHALREMHGRAYERVGRWIIVAAIFAGWVIGVSTWMSTVMATILLGFISGGVVMNSVLAELPKKDEGRFLPFIIGAAAYSLILLLAG